LYLYISGQAVFETNYRFKKRIITSDWHVDFVEYRNFKEMEKYAPYIDYFLISGEESILPIFEAFSKKV